MYALVDCNNFYASCERVFRPELNGKPVIVLSNNDGCVIARSQEAKDLGIAMGAPLYQIRSMVERNNVNVFSSNFILYGDMSQRVMTILSEYSPSQEIYSIDECFLNLDGIIVDYKKYGEKIRKHVGKWTGIPICVGIAPTKALAKVANRVAKKFPQLNGVHVIDSEEKRIKALKWIKIEDVWGVGRRYAKKLQRMGVNTAYDFTMLPESTVRKLMTVVGWKLQQDLKGIPAIDMEVQEPRQTISTTRTFDHEYSEYSELKERIATFVTLSAEKLRAQNSLCKRILIFIETNRFREEEDFYSNSIMVKLPFYTSSTIELVNFAMKGLDSIFLKNRLYKRAGVTLLDFENKSNHQIDMFCKSDPKHEVLMESIDKINQRFGKQSVHVATADNLTHKMKRDYLSKCYTTRWTDIINIKA